MTALGAHALGRRLRAAGVDGCLRAEALKLIGRQADGFILQLADPYMTAGRSVGPRAAAAGRTGPRRRSRSASPRRRTWPTDSAHQRDQCRWFGGMVGNHVADLVARYGDPLGGARGPDRLHRGPSRLRLQPPRRPGTPPRTSSPTRSWTASVCSAPRRITCVASRSCHRSV